MTPPRPDQARDLSQRGIHASPGLSPYATTNQKGPDPATVTIVPPGNTATGDLDKYDVVIAANVERFTPAQARDLEQYVYGGGGVLFAPGNIVRTDDYNDTLFAAVRASFPPRCKIPPPLTDRRPHRCWAST